MDKFILTAISSISKPHKQASFRGIPPTEESLVDVPKPPNVSIMSYFRVLLLAYRS